MNLLVKIKQNKDLTECDLINFNQINFKKLIFVIIMSDRVNYYFEFFRKNNLLHIFFKELNDCYKVKQNKEYHKYDVYNHLIKTCEATDKNIILRLSAILHDIGKPSTKDITVRNKEVKITFYKHEIESYIITKQLFQRLKINPKSKLYREVLFNIRQHMYYYKRDWSKSAVRRLMKTLNIDNSYIKPTKKESLELVKNNSVFKLRQADRLGNGNKPEAITSKQIDLEEKIVEILYEDQINNLTLAISGRDIISILNIEPGSPITSIVRILKKLVFKNLISNNYDDLKQASIILYTKIIQNKD